MNPNFAFNGQINQRPIPHQPFPQTNMRTQTIVAQPRPIQMPLNPPIGSPRLPITYPSGLGTFPTPILRPGIQQPFIQTHKPISQPFGLIITPPPISTIQQTVIPPTQQILVPPTAPPTAVITQVTTQIQPFNNPFSSQHPSQILIAQNQTQTPGGIISQTSQNGSQINTQQTQIIVLNNQNPNSIIYNTNNLQSSLHPQQIMTESNNSLIRAQINQSHINEWQPIQTPRIYTFDYGFHS